MRYESGLEDHERRIVSTIFVWGLSVSTVAMVAGFLLHLANGNGVVAAVDFSHIGDMTLPGALMGTGIGIMAATPVANVAALLFFWARHRQFNLVAIASTVLLTLILATILGQA